MYLDWWKQNNLIHMERGIELDEGKGIHCIETKCMK